MPTTLPYEKVSGLIESIIFTEGKKHPHIGFEFDDIAQEIRLICIKALSSFDPTRIGPSAFKYLQTCTHNHLYNMNRGTFVPNNPPCARCPLWDKLNRKCEENEEGCDKILQYRKRMANKAALKNPTNNIEDNFNDFKTHSDIDSFILDHSIRQKLPSYLLIDYYKMLAGSSDKVSLRHKSQIRKIVKKLMQDG